MTIREEIYNQLKPITKYVSQGYPNTEFEYPIIIFNANTVAKADHDGLAYNQVFAEVEIYSELSTEMAQLETKVQELMIAIGYINTSSNQIPDSKYYRLVLRFESIK